jgi:alcohol dehydrogenase
MYSIEQNNWGIFMKAAQISTYGGKDVLQINDNAAKLAPVAGQVLVEVAAAGVNPFDVKVRDGLTQQMAELHFPATLGGDVAGTVAELGEGVSDFAVGQAVYGQANALSGQGSFAEYTAVKAESLAPKPSSIDFATAAAIPLVGVSAYQALVDHMNLQAGQKILIHGGAGGIGSLAIQLAKHLGAYVATTAKPEDTDFVKGLGADEVIDYTSQDFGSILKDYDAVYDVVGGETFQKSFLILNSGGTLVTMVEKGGEELAKEHHVTVVNQFTRVTTERLTKLAELIDHGVIKPSIDKIFSLDEAAEALEYLKVNHPRGKVVIQIKE